MKREVAVGQITVLPRRGISAEYVRVNRASMNVLYRVRQIAGFGFY